MNKKNLFLITITGASLYILLKQKKNNYSAEELEKIEKYQKYLESKDMVVLTKKQYKKNKNNSILSFSSIPNYYTIAKHLLRYLS